MSFGISNFELGSTRDELIAQYPGAFSPNLFFLGISGAETMNIKKKYLIDAHFDIMFHNTQRNSSEDSIQYTWSGWHIGLDAGIDLFPKQKRFDIITALGLNMGSFKLVQETEFDDARFNTNPFIAPKFIFEPRLFIGKYFCFSLRSELMIDLSNSQWKIKNNGVDNLGATKATGFNILFTISANMGKG